MSNISNIGWEPLQIMMRDINGNVPDELKHLPFTDEVNQLLLSALSSGEHVQNNYYGVDSSYYRNRYGLSSDANSPYSNTASTGSLSPNQSVSSALGPHQPPAPANPSPQLSPPQPAHNKSMKLQNPNIQLPNNQLPITTAQLSPRSLQNQLLSQIPQPQLQQTSQQPQNVSQNNKTSQQQQQQQPQGRYQQSSLVGNNQQPIHNQISNQGQMHHQVQMQQLQQISQMQQLQQLQQNQQEPRTSLQTQLLQHLQKERAKQQAQQGQLQQQPQQTTAQSTQQNQSVQVKQQPVPSPPQSHSCPDSPSNVPLPSSPELGQQRHPSPTRQHILPHLMGQQLPPQYYSQMLPSHLGNSHLLGQPQLMNMQQLSTLQQLQQQQAHLQLQPTQPTVKQSTQTSTLNQSQSSIQPTTQTQTTQSSTSTQNQTSSQTHSQFLRSVAQSSSANPSPGASTPLESLSPTDTLIYQFINVKDEQQDPIKTKPLTEKQKNRRRASQNLASRNYRQRKKEYITTVEDRAQDLERQNEQLRRQINQKELIISKLSKENSTLRTSGNLGESTHDVEDLEDADAPIDFNMQELIFKLERTLKLETIENDDDAERTGLKSTLQLFYGSLQDRHDRYTNQVKEIVNPCTQAKLSALDSDPTSPFDNGFTENDDEWWVGFSKDANITEEQAAKIKEIRRDHSIEFQRLRTERKELNKDIRTYYKTVFSSVIGGVEDNDADVKMEELVEKLNSLKQNLDDEKRLILQTHAAMSKILTPKQEAVLVTRSYNKVVRSNATIQMVTNMYEVVLKESALAKCCAPGWEVL